MDGFVDGFVDGLVDGLVDGWMQIARTAGRRDSML
jgi:hypothetical protein